MGDIKPIQTYYNGYHFRSRLEARWAVFFDAMGIKYEYEKEGYTLSNGEKYLPDFYLPEFYTWAEVKQDRIIGDIPKYESGFPIWGEANGYAKLKQLCDDLDDAGILLAGPPLDGMWYQIVVCDTCDSGGGEYFEEPCATFAVDYYGKPKILVSDCRDDRTFWTRGFGGRLDGFTSYCNFLPPSYLSADQCMYLCLDPRWGGKDVYGDYLPYQAAMAARQARFEHGETPTI